MLKRLTASLAFAIGLAGGVGGANAAAPQPDAQLRTITSTPELVAKGKAAFAMCVGCHGAEGEGRVGMAPKLTSKSFLASASDRMLVDVITKGRAGTTMVPWGASLKPDQVQGIVAWLRSKTPSDPVQLNEGPLKGDLATGERVFRTICSMCHGRSGAGYQESGSGTGIGRAVFLDTATNGYLRYITRHGKTETKMRPFALKSPAAVANLSDLEIDSVILWLRKSAW